MKNTVIRLKCMINPRVNWKMAKSRVKGLKPKFRGFRKRSLTAP